MLKKILYAPLLFLMVISGCSGSDDTPVTPDTTAPEVVSTFPVGGATNVPVGATVSATFSEEMDKWTFNDTTFVISGGVTGPILYGNKTVILTPAADLAYNQPYTAVITTNVTDAAGNNLESNFTWSFTTTLGEIMPLAVGNQWEFWVEVIDTVTGQSNDSLGIVKIVKDTLIQSETWFVDSAGTIYTNQLDGLWGRSASDQPYLFLKFPAMAGDSYFGNPDKVETILVDSTSVLRGVPHGNHVCHLYISTTSDPTFKYKYYYKPNFGPVAIEKVTSGSLKVAERWSLVRLTLQ